MLVAEAPGAKEDQNGQPFSGPAGKLLDTIFQRVCGMNTNSDMLLTNMVFCRPVDSTDSNRQNYTPRKEQIVRCLPFVEKSIDLLKPKVIIACGRTALCALMEDDSMRMNAWEGRWLERKGISVFVMLHPAAILHKTNDPIEQHETKLRVQKYMLYFKDTYQEKLNG
jgi:DNA polymerase